MAEVIAWPPALAKTGVLALFALMAPDLPRVAALTMVRDEAVFLPIWCRHYLRQVGAPHLYVLDHASRDGSTEEVPAQVIPLPDGPLDEDLRLFRVTEAVAGLLSLYDWVIHSDVDELVLADPRHFPTLAHYAASEPAPAARAIGLDLHHLPEEESPLDPAAPLGGQRRWVRFSASMCKPVLVREIGRWTRGFHASEPEGRFGPLYCVHLRYVDLGLGLDRLARTRGGVAPAGAGPGVRDADAQRGKAAAPRGHALRPDAAAAQSLGRAGAGRCPSRARGGRAVGASAPVPGRAGGLRGWRAARGT